MWSQNRLLTLRVMYYNNFHCCNTLVKAFVNVRPLPPKSNICGQTLMWSQNRLLTLRIMYYKQFLLLYLSN
jgi:hypothetical protein